MGGRILLMMALCAVYLQAQDTTSAEISIFSQDLAESPSLESIMDYSTGGGLLAFEFVGIPVLSRYLNWKNPIHWDNPFRHIKESEPYFMDESWHFVGASLTSEFNYKLLSEYLKLEDPLLLSGLLSLAFWTGMECLDGLAGAGFSLRDQTANTLGAAFGILKVRYPELPIFVRIGVEDWGRFAMFAQSGFDRQLTGTDFYSMFKTEFIYVFDNDLYTGIALSKGKGKKNYSNRLGISVGWDLLNDVGKDSDSWFVKKVDFFRKYLIMSIGVTYWPDRLEFKSLK